MQRSWHPEGASTAVIRFQLRQQDSTGKTMKTTHGILYSHAAESSQGPQAQEAATKRKAMRLRPYFCSFVAGMKNRENSRRNKISRIVFGSLKRSETKRSSFSADCK